MTTRLTIYLPDELAVQAEAAGLNLSAFTPGAVGKTLSARFTDLWLASREPSSLQPVSGQAVSHDDVIDALDAVRDKSPTRHG